MNQPQPRMRHGECEPSVAIPPGEQDEVALVSRVAAGDRSAFEALYRIYYRRLTRFIQQLSRSFHLVDEILDDTMLVVWRKGARFNGHSRVSTWIFAIAYNEVMRAHHRERRASRLPSHPDDGVCVQSLETDYIEGEARAKLRHVVTELSVEQRAVVELTYFHGFGYKEIAAITGCPLNTVKTRMFHARRRLKALLAEHAQE
jgi:RNA polymerase sigma-70 factor, ECF subfamily